MYKVVHRQSGKTAALKYVPNPKEKHKRGKSGSHEDEVNRARFEASRREAEVMGRFRGDKNVVQFLERPEFLQRTFVDQWGDQVWQYAALICMPLYLGSRVWIPRVVGNRKACLRLGMQMAQALRRRRAMMYGYTLMRATMPKSRCI